MDLLKAAVALCTSHNIDKESLLDVYWIYTEPFSDTPVGMGMKYKNKSKRTRIIISLTNGWTRDYPFTNHVDIVYAVRRLRKQNFTVRSISNMLGVSHDLICRIIVGVDRSEIKQKESEDKDENSKTSEVSE